MIQSSLSLHISGLSRSIVAHFQSSRSYSRYTRLGMDKLESRNASVEKKLIRIDVSSDTVCPWCFVGKKNLEKAMDVTKDQFVFEVRWHPFFLNPGAPKEGMDKRQFYKDKFGSRAEQIANRMSEVFRSIGLEYNMSGLTGNTLDSHRLIYLAGNQGLEKQNKLVDELFLGYFTQGKYIGDRDFLVEAANKTGLEGAAEFLADPNCGLQEVHDELEKYSLDINGVPNFVINDKVKINGGQPPENFMRAFQVAAS